ncbi:S-layer homology domain-containing protein [Paenibacillus sp. NEAU-GSW1]|uniref:S-layer homology domain-containing protein n=1 Tax=Paenibacillus sp. NEAU-GSW1 TaxID=2682486 RepID=UPI0020A66969|nr:S-layer homology domain-containing protein [Paenibacillus sp. NEAU-GSW1]
MRKKPFLLTLIAMLFILTFGQTVWAFSDTKDDSNESKIEALQKLGVINGESEGKFNPKGKLTYTAGISMIVKGLELNIDHIRFVKAPKVTDHFPNLKDDAWYSSAFIIAQYSGLDIPVSVKANDEMTREQFAHHLFQAISRKGDFAYAEMYMLIKDEAKVDKAYMDSIQKLLITKIAALDAQQNFNPKTVITRSDAAAWLYDSIQFVKTATPVVQPDPAVEYKLTVEAVNKEVNKVTVSAQVPHPGYGIRIASITFQDNQAILQMELTQPDPDRMYPQVITDVSVTTYVDASLKPVIPSGGAGTSSFDGSDAVSGAVIR